MTAPRPVVAVVEALAGAVEAWSVFNVVLARFAVETVSPKPQTHPAARRSLDDWDVWAEYDKVTGR